MSKADNSKRSFFKKLAAIAGFLSAANVFGKLISEQANSIDTINQNSVNDESKQRDAVLNKKLVLMTDNEKAQMLNEMQLRDDMFDIFKKSKA